MLVTVSGDPASTVTGVPGAFYPNLTPALGEMTFPRTALSEGLKGKGIRVYFFRGGNSTVLCSPSVFF